MLYNLSISVHGSYVNELTENRIKNMFKNKYDIRLFVFASPTEFRMPV